MKNKSIAVFGGGCFWCVEAVIQRLRGVEKVVSGYAGGRNANPTYREICSGRTGHAEVVKVIFDADVISYEDLLKVFFSSHDPTTLNRQGADTGTQYRSIIMYYTEEQKAIAEKVMRELKDHFNKPIVTELIPYQTFYEAEDYHQNYYNENSSAGYCRIVINPKLKKLRKMYADRLKLEKASGKV